MELQKKKEEDLRLKAEEEAKAKGPRVLEESKEDAVPEMDYATLNRIYPVVKYKDADVQPVDNNINMVIIGHVDSGKSTLTGHLLYKLGHVTQQNIRKNEKLAETNGKAGFEFAYVMDELDEERERGVTIEVTTRYFSTENR